LAQEPEPKPAETQAEKPAESQDSAEPAAESEAGSVTPQPGRTAGQNLLGQEDTARGEGRRNENVQINLVDNNAARDANQRLGATATIVEEFRVDRNYFSAEYGNAGRGPIHAQPQSGAGIHGNLFWNHNNSILGARTFFQAGPVQPARQNEYGAGLSTGLWKGAFFSFTGSQDKNRGSVNGNVLIPLPGERVPLATDPVVRAMVLRFIDAYPNVAPNRPDVAARALNTNSPQTVNTDFAVGQLSQKLGSRDTLISRYTFTAQGVDAFQFVKGQNPNTRNKSHAARLTWDRAWSAFTSGDFSLGFDRQGVLLTPTADAVGPVFVTGLSALGPNSNVPVNRAINQFRAGASVQTRRGRHVGSFGGGLTRIQYNGDEPDSRLPVWDIHEDFGNSGITNLRLGRPDQLTQGFGDASRGYRNFELLAFAGDRWTVSNRLTLNFGARWEPVTKPGEIRNRSSLAFGSDWNNAGGNAGFAYRLGGGLGLLRGAYGVMFGQIFPATYGQDRLNPPYYARITIHAPDLVNPFAAFTAAELDPAHARAARFDVSPDLATPYSYQYNLSWEAEVHVGWRLQVGYVGSRSHKLFQTYVFNRARFVPGIDFTTATVNQRRPDPTITDRFYTGNFSNAYYDAGRVSLVAPHWHGAAISASYWLSKAIDLGGDYFTTGAGSERYSAIGPSEFNVHGEMKGLSSFDQPHAFLLQASYDTGRRGSGWLGTIFRNWSASSVYLLKSGTPFTVTSGSDGPGFGNVDGSPGDRPFVLDPAILGRTIGNPATSRQLLPRSAFRFQHAPPEIAGNLGRNTFRKGKIANLNASLARTWTLARELQMTLRAESINLTNTPQFAEPGSSLAAPNFGQINNTLNDGRAFRFLLRLVF
jgi:hypothetical protein